MEKTAAIDDAAGTAFCHIIAAWHESRQRWIIPEGRHLEDERLMGKMNV